MILPASNHIMDKPNVEIVLFESDAFLVKSEAIKMEVKGKILFKWLPTPTVVLKGESLQNTFEELLKVYDAGFNGDFELFFDSKPTGQLFLINWSSNGDVTFLINKEFKIPHFRKCDKVAFSLPNFPSTIVGTMKDGSHKHGQLILEWKDFLVRLNPVENHIDKYSKLKEVGGYIITYQGEMSRTGKAKYITKPQLDLLIGGLRFFLSFNYGYLTGPILEEGYLDQTKVWCDFSSRQIRRYGKFAPKFTPDGSADFYTRYWPKFMALWADKEQGQILKDVLHWYLEAKSNSDYTNNSIVLSQISLEILFHWVVKLRKKALDRNANLSAANQFRLMLSLLNVKKDIPEKFDLITSKVESDQKLIDGIDYIVQVRNSQVHSNDTKRSYSTMELYQTKELFLHYIECSITAIMDEEV